MNLIINIAVVGRLENFLSRVDAELNIISCGELGIGVTRPSQSYICLIKNDCIINLFLIEGMHRIDGHSYDYYCDLTRNHDMTQLTDTISFFVATHHKKIELFEIKGLL